MSHRRTVSEGLPGSSRLILASRASLDIVRMPDAFGQYSRYARALYALARPVEACNDAVKNSGRLRQCPALETISCSAPLQWIQQTVNALINTLVSAVVDQCTCASNRIRFRRIFLYSFRFAAVPFKSFPRKTVAQARELQARPGWVERPQGYPVKLLAF